MDLCGDSMGRAIWGTQNVFDSVYTVDIEDFAIQDARQIIDEALAVLETCLHLEPNNLSTQDITRNSGVSGLMMS